MSISKCVLLTIFLLALTDSINAQPKAGTLQFKSYTFENDKGEKVESEFGRSGKPVGCVPRAYPERSQGDIAGGSL